MPSAAGCFFTSSSHLRKMTFNMMFLWKHECLNLGTCVLLQQWPYTSEHKMWCDAADCYLIFFNDIQTRQWTSNFMKLTTGQSQVLIKRTELYVNNSWYFECSSRPSSLCTWNWFDIAFIFYTIWWWSLVLKVYLSHSHWAEISLQI